MAQLRIGSQPIVQPLCFSMHNSFGSDTFLSNKLFIDLCLMLGLQLCTGDDASSTDGLSSSQRSEVDYSTLAKAEAAAHQQPADRPASRVHHADSDVGHLALAGADQDAFQLQAQATGTELLPRTSLHCSEHPNMGWRHQPIKILTLTVSYVCD